MNQSDNGKVFGMVAKCMHGLEDVLADELRELGAENIRPFYRSVTFRGSKELLYKANLHLRTASRILKPVEDFMVHNEGQLYKNIYDIKWEYYLNLKQTFAIDVVLNNSAFKNSLYVAQKTKDGIVDYFRDNSGKRPSVDLKSPDIRISVYIENRKCTIAIDSSGEPLFKRGYRTKTGIAPLNENLGAGLILISEWDKKSTFVDAMCGSGTIPIEAAMIARNIAPCINREHFGFMNWQDYDKEMFNKIREEAKKNKNPSLDFEIVGSDKDSRQLSEAIQNSKTAGVSGDISFTVSDISDFTPPEDSGTLIINPPYGERMEVEEIAEFYHTIGDAFKKNFEGYDAFFFTGNGVAAKSIGLRTSRKIILHNGAIECRLLKFEMYRGTRKVKSNE